MSSRIGLRKNYRLTGSILRGLGEPIGLIKLVERGFMTEEGADEFRSWFEGLPKDFDEWGPDFSKDGDFEFDSDDGRFRFRWRWDGSDDDWFFERDPEYGKGRKNGV